LNENIYNFIFDATFAYQLGSENDKKINACGIFGKFGYQFSFLKWNPVLSIRETYASGGRKTDNIVRTFDPAFGASDKYYGWMNIMKWSNLDDREIVLELHPKKGYWIEIKYNWFFVPVPDDVVLLKNLKLIPGEKHLGDEFNIFARFNITKRWQLTGLFGYFWPKDVQSINALQADHSKMFAVQVLFVL
jgi:hypothetical protein